jgi:hypothetical protein
MTKLRGAIKFLPFICRGNNKKKEEGSPDTPAAVAAIIARREEEGSAATTSAAVAESAQAAEPVAAKRAQMEEELAITEAHINELEAVESKLRRKDFKAELECNEVESTLARIGDERHILAELSDVERGLRERHDAVERKENARMVLKGELKILGLMMGAVKCHDGSAVFSQAQECEAELTALYDELITLRADEVGLEAEARRKHALLDEKRKLEARLERLLKARKQLSIDRSVKQEELERARVYRDNLKALLAEHEAGGSGERQEPTAPSTNQPPKTGKRKVGC